MLYGGRRPAGAVLDAEDPRTARISGGWTTVPRRWSTSHGPVGALSVRIDARHAGRREVHARLRGAQARTCEQRTAADEARQRGASAGGPPTA